MMEGSEIQCEACRAILFYGEWDLCDGCREKIEFSPSNYSSVVPHSTRTKKVLILFYIG